MADIKFSEFTAAVSVAGADEVVGLKNGNNTRFPHTLFVGADGPQGPQGPQGVQGIQGIQGATGATGPAGADGLNGADGADGATGPQGPAGADGAQGPQGIQGPVGPQGPQGDAGSGYILQGDETVANLNALDATTITDNFAWFMLDAGVVQPIGATQGTSCVAGDLLVWSAADHFVNYGPQQGQVGPQGPQGDDGPQGPQGIQGATGATGPAGADGAQGPQGIQGPAGAQGPTGPEGPTAVSADAGNEVGLGTDSLLYYQAPVFSGAGAKGMVPNPGVENLHFLRDDGQFVVIPFSPVGGLAFNYDFLTNTAATDPGAGNIKLNNANSSLATAIYVSSTSKLGNNLDNFWQTYRPNDFLGLWERETDRESDYFQINGTPTNNGGWWTVPVTWASGTGGIENLAQVDVYPIHDPADRMPAGGAIGQQLVKQSNQDYDTIWSTPAGGGDVTGPASAVDGNIASFNGATGKAIQDAGVSASLVATSVQPGDNVSVLNNDAGYLDQAAGDARYYTQVQADGLFAAIATEVPAGGTTGQTLVKNSNSDYDMVWTTPAGGGDVTGPASSVDKRIATFDGVTGKLIQDSGSLIADLATAAQGALADSAVQPGDNVSVLNNDAGYASGDVVGPASAVDNNFASFDLTTGKLIQDSGSNAASFATAAQGALADSALQSGDNISELNNDAGYGTGDGDVAGPASAVDDDIALFNGTSGKIIKDSGVKTSSFATSAQGALADSATQPGDNLSTLTNDENFRPIFSGAVLPAPGGYNDGDFFAVIT